MTLFFKNLWNMMFKNNTQALEVIVPEATEEPTSEIAAPKETIINLPKKFYEYELEEHSHTRASCTNKLALKMMEHDDAVHDLLHAIRVAIASKTPKNKYSFSYDCTTLNQQQRNKMREITNLLMDGYLTECNSASCRMTGKVSQLPGAIWFLNGGYLELAITQVTNQIMADLSHKYGFDYSVKSNVVIHNDDGSYNEFDVIIDINETTRLAIEVKSGYYREYDKYYFIGQKYDILPNNFLLVQTGLSDESIERIMDVTKYKVCNTSQYRTALSEMVIYHLDKAAEIKQTEPAEIIHAFPLSEAC